MELLLEYIYYLAWVFGVISTANVILAVFMAFNYSKLDELKDKMNGVRRSFPVITPGIVMILCWVWILIN